MTNVSIVVIRSESVIGVVIDICVLRWLVVVIVVVIVIIAICYIGLSSVYSSVVLRSRSPENYSNTIT